MLYSWSRRVDSDGLHLISLFIFLTANTRLGGLRQLSDFFRNYRRPWRRQGCTKLPENPDQAKNNYWGRDDDRACHHESNDDRIFHFCPTIVN